MAALAQVRDQFGDQRWRLNNLYWITDKEGVRVPFRTNWAQEALFDDLHYLNLVLKARQLGFTTFIQLYMLDVTVFYPDTRCGVIAHTKDDAEAIFRDKIKFPYDNLPDGIKAAVPIVRDNTTTMELANNSIIRVGTSLRGGTLQYLHVSEYGKICARFPEKAREIATGALNTVQAGQVAFIESTAEGQEGRFYEMCDSAQSHARMGGRLTPLDWKFHFFPWWKEPAYTLDSEGVVIPPTLAKYFHKLAGQGIALTAGQRAWYAKKLETQKEDMKREYPSTPQEAFEASVEGAYFGTQIADAELAGRIGVFPALRQYPVHTVQDIGVGDANTIWFFQIVPKGIRVVGYYENSGEGMPHYCAHIKAEFDREREDEEGTFKWKPGRHWLPHDAKVREWGTGLTRVEQFKKAMGVMPDLVPDHYVEDGIEAAREVFGICLFDEEPCADGLKSLRNYRKEWDEERACWKDKPRHDWASHGADGYRYLAMSYREMVVKVEKKAPPPKGIRDMTFNQLMGQQRKQFSGRV